MAGHGPAPKDPARRVRRNKAPENRVVLVEPDAQPSLFDVFGVVNPATGKDWEPASLLFWDQLRVFPTTRMLVGAQWSLLGVALMLFDRVASGRLGYAEEMRRELAAFGIAPADLARLRISFAVADESESRVVERRQVSQYGDLRAVE